jgi:hypothetical protein
VKSPLASFTVALEKPQQGMRRMSAALKVGPHCLLLDWYGIREKEDPVSTRKRRPVSMSVMKKSVPGCAAAAVTPRPPSFPGTMRLALVGLVAELGVVEAEVGLLAAAVHRVIPGGVLAALLLHLVELFEAALAVPDGSRGGGLLFVGAGVRSGGSGYNVVSLWAVQSHQFVCFVRDGPHVSGVFSASKTRISRGRRSSRRKTMSPPP